MKSQGLKTEHQNTSVHTKFHKNFIQLSPNYPMYYKGKVSKYVFYHVMSKGISANKKEKIQLERCCAMK